MDANRTLLKSNWLPTYGSQFIYTLSTPLNASNVLIEFKGSNDLQNQQNASTPVLETSLSTESVSTPKTHHLNDSNIDQGKSTTSDQLKSEKEQIKMKRSVTAQDVSKPSPSKESSRKMVIILEEIVAYGVSLPKIQSESRRMALLHLFQSDFFYLNAFCNEPSFSFLEPSLPLLNKRKSLLTQQPEIKRTDFIHQAFARPDSLLTKSQTIDKNASRTSSVNIIEFLKTIKSNNFSLKIEFGAFFKIIRQLRTLMKLVDVCDQYRDFVSKRPLIRNWKPLIYNLTQISKNITCDILNSPHSPASDSISTVSTVNGSSLSSTGSTESIGLTPRPESQYEEAHSMESLFSEFDEVTQVVIYSLDLLRSFVRSDFVWIDENDDCCFEKNYELLIQQNGLQSIYSMIGKLDPKIQVYLCKKWLYPEDNNVKKSGGLEILKSLCNSSDVSVRNFSKQLRAQFEFLEQVNSFKSIDDCQSACKLLNKANYFEKDFLKAVHCLCTQYDISLLADDIVQVLYRHEDQVMESLDLDFIHKEIQIQTKQDSNQDVISKNAEKLTEIQNDDLVAPLNAQSSDSAPLTPAKSPRKSSSSTKSITKSPDAITKRRTPKASRPIDTILKDGFGSPRDSDVLISSAHSSPTQSRHIKLQDAQSNHSSDRKKPNSHQEANDHSLREQKNAGPQQLLDILFDCLLESRSALITRVTNACLLRIWRNLAPGVHRLLLMKMIKSPVHGNNLVSSVATPQNASKSSQNTSLVDIMSRGKGTRQLLIQSIFDILLSTSCVNSEKQLAAIVFSKIAIFMDKNVISDFLFKCLLRPSSYKHDQDDMKSQEGAYDSKIDLDSHPREASFNSDSKTNKWLEVDDFHRLSNKTRIVVDDEIIVSKSRISIDYDDSKDLYGSTYGILLCIKHLCQVPEILKQLSNLRIIAPLTQFCFETMNWGNNDIRRVSEDIIKILEASSINTEIRPQVFTMLGIMQRKQNSQLIEQENRISKLEALTETLQSELLSIRTMLSSKKRKSSKKRSKQPESPPSSYSTEEIPREIYKDELKDKKDEKKNNEKQTSNKLNSSSDATPSANRTIMFKKSKSYKRPSQLDPQSDSEVISELKKARKRRMSDSSPSPKRQTPLETNKQSSIEIGDLTRKGTSSKPKLTTDKEHTKGTSKTSGNIDYTDGIIEVDTVVSNRSRMSSLPNLPTKIKN